MMDEDWESFLRARGAVVDAGCAGDFGAPLEESAAALDGNCLADLSHTTLVEFSGTDTVKFLQGQMTCDVQEVDEGHSRPGAWCNTKGRVLMDFRLFGRAGSVFLHCPLTDLQAHLDRLRMYVIRADVAIADVSDRYACLGVSGPEAAQSLAGLIDAVPAQIDGCAQSDELVVIRVPGPHPRFVLCVPAAGARALWEGLEQRLRPVGAAAWSLLDIMAGVAVTGPRTSGEFVPQMLNLQAVGAVSFTKGCYPGQEIVARTRYLGKLKRRLYLATCAADDLPEAGDRLYATGCDAGSNVGTVVNARPHPRGGIALLAVIHNDCAGQGTVTLDEAGRARLDLQELPYSLDDD